jgi:hypothetical protein
VKGGCYRRHNRPFGIIYVTITSMIAGLPLRLASRPRFSASWSFHGFDLQEVGRVDVGTVVVSPSFIDHAS